MRTDARSIPPGRAAVPADRIRRLTAADLGAGPWGADASPTWVGPVKVMAVSRARIVAARRAARRAGARRRARRCASAARCATPPTSAIETVPAAPARGTRTRGRGASPSPTARTRPASCSASRRASAAEIDGHVVAITLEDPEPAVLAAWGADEIVHLDGANVEEDVATAVVDWAEAVGAVGDHHRLDRVGPRGRVTRRGAARRRPHRRRGRPRSRRRPAVAWKPAFGGQLVAAIGATSPIQMATVRAGMITAPAPRPVDARARRSQRSTTYPSRGRVRVLARTRDDDLDVLAEAAVVIGVGRGVAPDEYDALEPLRELLGAELGATRKVTDEGWLPRARQVGITGRSIAPRLFVSIGASGKFNHTVGVRAARTVLAINPDPSAPIFQAADVGIVADWRDALPLLVDELRRVLR